MRSILFTSCLFIFIGVSAQGKLADRIYFGGGFGFSAGADQTNLSLSPQVGYKITEKFSAGVGISYQYVKIKQPSISINNYGWSLFTRYNIVQQFFAYSEFERLSFEYVTGVDPVRKERTGYNSLLIGGGYAEQLGGRASFSLMALYNVLYDETDFPRPYNSPWVIRAGIGVGIF
ncbi:hypothetical protein SAMN05421640_2410 [Ekhidna lutea]|uniref:Outer membrane protein beta-barrel domain-containing protein n=1 Tax=Ekhidna lutea TaxID=447679 RepID=A0A239K5K7_EKHLU|nr:hypothetical protein [Ekhidna lutea]SNT12933.1 hypothetical protein SAMN05421640_2410 [Ekhidna lutea]